MQNNHQGESKKIQEKQVNIKGMHCKSCADKIENKLKALKGIQQARVSFAKEEASIQFDAEQITAGAIKQGIKEMGYKVFEMEASGSPLGSDIQGEKMIKIRLEKSDILMALVAITLLFAFINLFHTISLKNQLASVASGAILESDNQDSGGLQEVDSKQPPQADGAPSQAQGAARIEAGVDNDPVTGSPDAPVTIIEFSDFECPFCARFVEQTLPQIEENYIKTGKAKLVFRDFPLPFHQDAQKAHEAAECADEQGKFWEYHDLLFENYQSLDVESLKKYAQDLGIGGAVFNQCLDSGEMAQEVQDDLSDGSGSGVSGTPTFFINGIQLVGAQPFNVFEQIIEQELNK